MSDPRFLVDEMLGSLARWLRIMGYDTEYVRGMDDDDILKHAVKDGRALLTRDRELARRAGDCGMLLQGDDVVDHLESVVQRFCLIFDVEGTRCTSCNQRLTRISPKEAGDRVPARVLERHREFFICPSCGQIYWKGTHWKGICERVEEAVRRARTGNDPH